MSISRKLLRVLPDSLYLQLQYFKNYKKFLNLKRPVTYADKLCYLKLHSQDKRLTQLVDKYNVRSFVEKRIGGEYLVPLIGVYKTVDQIPWNELPEKFVLKCTHDSASIVLHPNNENFNKKDAIEKLDSHLKRNLYDYSREYPYKNVEPQIICEQYLESGSFVPDDYKVMCFDGDPKYIILDQGRFVDHHRDVYDNEWKKVDIGTDHAQTSIIRPKPDCLEHMLELAKNLSKGFTHVRVDFYYVQGHIYFGEMTFFPWGGIINFTPDYWNIALGDLIKL